MPPAAAQPQPGCRCAWRGVNVAAPFRGQAFVYRMTTLRYETDYYSEFLVAPAAMLAEQTARALVAARRVRRVIAGPGARRCRLVLDGFASALYADSATAGKPAAELAITYYLSPAGGAEQTPVGRRSIARHAPMRAFSARRLRGRAQRRVRRDPRRARARSRGRVTAEQYRHSERALRAGRGHPLT